MRPPGGQGEQRDVAKQLKVLMPSCFHKLLAGLLDAGKGGAETPQPTALVVNSFGKVWHVEVGQDDGGAFLGRGWPEFVAVNGFGVGWFLVIRHEGRGVLTVKAFDLTCCLTESGGIWPSTVTSRNIYASHKPQFIKVLLPDFMEKMVCKLSLLLFSLRYTEKQKEAHSSSRKRKRKNEGSSGKEDTRPKGSVISSNKGSWKERMFCSLEIGQPSWIKKEMSICMLEKFLSLARSFCDWIGFVRKCTITLKTSNKSNKCWQVVARRYENYGYLGGESWKSFCTENHIREGDVCTFHIVETTVWHVEITRCSD
ncbi:unnamed protein product [Alopecurus aequalis]